MHIANKLDEIGIGINQKSLVTSLEQVSQPIFSLIDESSVTKGKIMEDFCQGQTADLNDKVDMVGHQAEGMYPAIKTLYAFLEQQQKTASVLLGKENILPTVAAQQNMINPTWNMKSGFASHVLR